MTRLLALIALTSGCMHPLTTYNRHASYDLDDTELRDLQVYLSHKIVLERHVSSNQAIVDDARVKVEHGHTTEVVVFRRGLPGEIVSVDLISRPTTSFCGPAPQAERAACEQQLIHGSQGGHPSTDYARQREVICVAFDPKRKEDCLLFTAITDAPPRTVPTWPDDATQAPFRVEAIGFATGDVNIEPTFEASYAGKWWHMRFNPDFNERPYLTFRVQDMVGTERDRRRLPGRRVK